MSERERAMGADREREQDGVRGTWGSKVISIIKITSRVCEGWSFVVVVVVVGKGEQRGDSFIGAGGWGSSPERDDFV